MAEFIQIDRPLYTLGPVFLGLSNVRFARATSTSVIDIYYVGDSDFTTLTFSYADTSYTLHQWFFSQMTEAKAYSGSTYFLPPIIPVGGVDGITFSSISP